MQLWKFLTKMTIKLYVISEGSRNGIVIPSRLSSSATCKDWQREKGERKEKEIEKRRVRETDKELGGFIILRYIIKLFTEQNYDYIYLL